MSEMPETTAGATPGPSTDDAATPAAPSTAGAQAGTAGDEAPLTGPGGEPLLTPDVVRLALRKVKDPELNLNIVDLGLIYDVRVDGARVAIDMSLTSPGCPSGPEIMTEAERKVREIPEVEDVAMNLVWSPMWTPERIEPRVRAYMGF
jgi:metal-sulfur cluster biosynthetic enzyme